MNDPTNLHYLLGCGDSIVHASCISLTAWDRVRHHWGEEAQENIARG